VGGDVGKRERPLGAGVAVERLDAALGLGVGEGEDGAGAPERPREREQRRRPCVEGPVPLLELPEEPLRVAARVLEPDDGQLRQRLDRDARRRGDRVVVAEHRRPVGGGGHRAVVAVEVERSRR
jgi:hypothetical protein